MSKYKYIYGPVSSWRLGSSLGIDLLSQKEKICNFNCLYCQLGPTLHYTINRQVYVSVKEIMKEINALPALKIDYITFSGRGEPTLARNLGRAIKTVKAVCQVPIAVLTNSSFLYLDKVRKELLPADFVAVKLDAHSLESMQKVNDPAKNICFEKLLTGIMKFREQYQGWLAVQVMFVEQNKSDINRMISLINHISPDEVQINTPLRTCEVKPLPKSSIFEIKNAFFSACKGMKIISVYDKRAPKVISSISDEDTLRRRSKI